MVRQRTVWYLVTYACPKAVRLRAGQIVVVAAHPRKKVRLMIFICFCCSLYIIIHANILQLTDFSEIWDKGDLATFSFRHLLECLGNKQLLINYPVLKCQNMSLLSRMRNLGLIWTVPPHCLESRTLKIIRVARSCKQPEHILIRKWLSDGVCS